MTELRPEDKAKSPILRDRIAACERNRLKMKAPATQAMAATSHLFAQRTQPPGPFLAIPRHVGGDHPYFPVLAMPDGVVNGDANFTGADTDGFVFGVLSSSMFIEWMRLVGGRTKSDPRFSKNFTYNNFPLPPVTPKHRERIIAAGQDVSDARNRHPDRCLAQHYEPGTLDPELLKAHRGLDRAVDQVFSTKVDLSTRTGRHRVLLDRYARLTGQEQLALSRT